MPVFSFLNPGFLWALPLASIPILIHLLSRRRLPEVTFPTTQFLRQLEPREIRRLRLRELLLLLLRTLAVAFLVVAFARPSFTPRHAVTHAAAAVAVLIDDSESMGALDEQAKTRIEGAKERARAIVNASRPGDELTLIPSTGPRVEGVEHTSDRIRLTRGLTRIEATALPANMPSALEAARRALERSHLRDRELYLVSDFQRQNFDPKARSEIARAVREGIRVYLTPLVESRVPNHAVLEVDPVVRPGPEARGLELRSQVANLADGPSERLALRVRRGDALVGGGELSLKADETRWVAMPLDWPKAAEGDRSGPVIVEADEDALPRDDVHYVVLGAPGRIRVLRIAEGREGAPPPRFTSLALDPGHDGRSGFVVEDGTPASLLALSRSRADVVLLEDVATLSSDAEARLRSFLRDGGGLVVALGPHADPAYYGSKLFPGLIDLGVEGPEQVSSGGSFAIRARLPGHDILEGFTVAVGGPLTQSTLTGIVRSRPLSPRAEIVVQTSGGLPLVAAAPGVAVFLSSLSDDWGDLPYSGAFVPLVRGLVSYAARSRTASLGPIRVGETPVARLSAPPAAAVLVRGPRGYGSQASIRAEGTGYVALADAPAVEPGFYEFESAGRSVATVAVNLDPVESDLASIPLDSLKVSSPRDGRVIVLSSLNALSTYLRDTRRGRELWMTFLLLACAALIGELLLGSARILKP
jgi:Aerotolerance regulator N-terminal/von Willebrand factor type A domain